MLGTPRDIDQIAEYADASARAVSAAPRAGSLPGIKGRHGLNEWLYNNYGNAGNALYTFIGSLLTIAISGGAAWYFDEPLLFPSLGATAFLFFETPLAEVSSPRNAIIGHYVAAAVAFFWLAVLDLINEPSAIEVGFTWERWVAIALSLGFTGGILRLLRAAHPPAGATTVIVALGLLDTWHQMLILANGAALVVIAAGILNRLMGVPAPLWDTPYAGLRERLYTGAGPRREGGRWVSKAHATPAAPDTPPPPVVPPSGLPQQNLPPRPKR